MQPVPAAAPLPAGPSVALVTMTEGLELQPEAAFLAGALRRLGARVTRLAVDFCTDEASYQAGLAALRPALVVLPYATEWAEMIARAAALTRAAVPETPIAVVGDALERERSSPSFGDGVAAVAGDPGLRIGAFLGRPAPASASHREIPLDVQLFGGPEILRRPTAASLFGELGTVGLLAARSGHETLGPTALLSRLEAPVAGGPLPLDPSAAVAPLEELGGDVRRVEWWDRDGLEAAVGLLPAVAARGVRQSVRILPERYEPGVLAGLAGAGADRVIFEVDRVAGAEPMPGSAASAEDLAPWVAAARRHGMEVGVLLVVGVPGETPENGRRRTEAVRALNPDRLRCVPFEPTGGHPVYNILAARGWWPPPDLRWIREVHRPLRQPGLDREAYVKNWSDALLLLAEVAVGGEDC